MTRTSSGRGRAQPAGGVFEQGLDAVTGLEPTEMPGGISHVEPLLFSR